MMADPQFFTDKYKDIQTLVVALLERINYDGVAIANCMVEFGEQSYLGLILKDLLTKMLTLI